MCECIFSDDVHGCLGKSEPGGRSFARVMVCFARLLSQISKLTVEPMCPKNLSLLDRFHL